MKTELSFLIDLLLNHKLSPAIKKILAERMREVEERLEIEWMERKMPPPPRPPNPTGQAPSTLARLTHHGMESLAEALPVPVEQIAQTPATAQAMQARSEAIAAATSGRNVMQERGKMERTSPRKW